MIKPESRFIELKYMILGQLVSDDAKLIKKILEIKSNGEINLMRQNQTHVWETATGLEMVGCLFTNYVVWVRVRLQFT